MVQADKGPSAENVVKMDEQQLMEEGYYNIYAQAGARTEMPGCSLCMGNQARVEDNATVFSTSTRNFPNRLGKGANVYLASAELAAAAKWSRTNSDVFVDTHWIGGDPGRGLEAGVDWNTRECYFVEVDETAPELGDCDFMEYNTRSVWLYEPPPSIVAMPSS